MNKNGGKTGKPREHLPPAQAQPAAPVIIPQEALTTGEAPISPLNEGFPIIGIGASAGGLEAFEQFFRNVPPACGMAFILVPHLDPGHASMLTEILQRSTAMPVLEAQDQMSMAPDHVYVIPPNRDMAIFHGALQLSVPETPRGQRMAIDFFLRSLAEDQGENAIGVILSGTGTDGTLGLRAIQGVGGVSFVQDPSTAKYEGMPASAVRSGLATYVLPAEKIPEQLTIYVKTLFRNRARPRPSAQPGKSAMNRIMQVIRSRTGHDFALYKQSTIHRRIERRMTVHNLEDTDTYARYLQEHPDEVHHLFKELLINVTSFFRDPEAFSVLKTDVLPKLFENKPENYVFRVWAPGCATGEEAYSIAIILREFMDELKQEFKVQIYATDIDEDAVTAARAGVYPPNIAIDISPERLRRFFVKEEAGFRVKKDIREMVIFATQNVIKDPPFTRLDLLSCRNLLIYLETELQNRLLPVFHYALKPGGALFLSSSEGIGNYHDLFAPLNKKWRFFTAKASSFSNRAVMSGLPAAKGKLAGTSPLEAVKKLKETNFAELTRRALLQYYAPSSVVTDEKGVVLYVHGDTGKYLRPAPGQASLNVVEMAREGLQLKLRTAVHGAAARKKPIVCRNVRVRTNGGSSNITVSIRPFLEPDTAQQLLIICFQDAETPAKGKAALPNPSVRRGEARRVEELEQELIYTRENLQATIEEMQATNEELKSTNEELQSTNEELQSTNEELETSKEELQSVNEELVTVNAELQAKIEQLSKMQNDMKNLLENTNIGTIFLDEQLAIKRFTREAAVVFRLVASDLGRPLEDIKSNIVGEDLLADAHEVLDTLIPREKQVRTMDDKWFFVRIMPYRTLENVIKGVVMTFNDITELKKAEEESSVAREYAEAIVDTVRDPLIVLNAELTAVSASRSFYSKFGISPQDAKGRHLYELGNRQWDIPRLRELLDAVLSSDAGFDNYEVEREFYGLGRRKLLLNARRITGKTGKPRLILLAMEDVTDK